MAAVSTTTEAFGISHAAILAAGTGVETLAGDIYGVNSGSIEVDADNYDNTGDDDVLSVWSWLNYAQLSIQGGYIPFAVVADMTNQILASSGAGNSIEYSMELWATESFNVAPRSVVLRMQARDEFGVPRWLDALFYKVQFQPITFDGPAYKDGLKVNYTGRALKSSVNEKGQAILNRYGNPTKSVGRLLSKPFV